jgi:S-(hydroxymethyl)glutathione dehydrogenase/alcohol dehydrogenase
MAASRPAPVSRVISGGHRPHERANVAPNSLDTNRRNTPMKAAVMYEVNKPLIIENVTVSKPGPHEILLRTAFAGLCHSDLHFIEGLYPHPVPVVLGHESAGIVEEVGSEVRYVKKGDHVITCLSVFCGTCENCNTGRPAICTNTEVKLPPGVAKRLSIGGKQVHTFTNLSSYAEQMLVHENAVVKVDKDFPLDRGALIGCGVITGFGAVVNTAKVRPGETVAVIGCGGVGMAAINGAAIAGAGRVIAIDTNPVKLQLATKLGATDLVNPKDGDPVQRVKELTKGGVHHAIECLGLKVTAEQSFNMLAAGGTATIVGMVPFGQKIELHGFDFLRERKIQGSSMGSNRFRVDMPRLIEFYKQGKLQLDDWISDRIPLADINQGFKNMKEGKVVRSVIDFKAA